MSSADDVAQAILDLCGNNIREHAMPTSSAILTTVAYLMPWISRFLRPTLEKKGARAKAKFKAQQKQPE